MKIKLAILEKDTNYLRRIVSVFETKYADKFEIYSFTDPAVAQESLDSAKIDVLIANDDFDIDAAALPKRCGFAYFVDSVDVTVTKDQRAICKFQRAEQIYKQILGLYSETAGNISGIKLDDDTARIVLFASPCGGVGSSTMAAACAAHFAAQGKRTLYLNLEKFGSADLFFSSEGQFDMSDIIFALKSKRANFSLKLESSVKQDTNGVYFFAQSKIALDMFELNSEELVRLISELKRIGSYDYLVIDTDFVMDEDNLPIYRLAHALVWVGDGSEISNHKIHRAYDALTVMEQKADVPLTNRICLIYNKFSNKSSQPAGDFGLRSIGGAPRYEHASTRQILAQLAPMEVFDKIV